MTEFVAPGLHLLIDFWNTDILPQSEIEKVLRQAAEVCGANVISVLLHSFGEGAGITGVAILSESHISIHTWPEIQYVALDVFMCGTCDPHKAVAVLKDAFNPEKIQVTTHSRGRITT